MKKTFFVFFIAQTVAFPQGKYQSPCVMPLGNVNTFAAVYFDYDSLNALGKFDMVVLDPANYDSTDIEKLKSLGAMPIAYLNIAEAETYRDYFGLVDTSMLLSPDSHWRYRYYADICNPAWQEIILRNRITDIQDRGFCGLFIDLSDLFNEYPEKMACAVSLIKKIRRQVGNDNLILDGGSKIIDQVGDYIDGLAVEGLMGYYDFDSEEYQIRADSTEDRESAFLINKAKKYRIRIFQLDYAPSSDEKSRENIVIDSRKLGFVPYVSTIELDTLFTDTIHRMKFTDTKKGKVAPDSLR